jgi:serine/threonine protein kinase
VVPQSGANVALKVFRSGPAFAVAGVREVTALRSLATVDDAYCVRMLTQFKLREHVVVVFEAMETDLRKLCRAAARRPPGRRGLPLERVRGYGAQLFCALRHTHHRGVVHADVKPDNLLVGGGSQCLALRLCDFGSAVVLRAMHGTTYEVSTYLVRAPHGLCVRGGGRQRGHERLVA